MKIVNGSNSLIIVLHEIYGLNQHMESVCKKLSMAGYDIICPNLINLNQPFEYESQEEAYKHFMNNIGFELAAEQVKQLMIQAKKQYRYVFLLGYSIGATIAWLCSSEDSMCDGIIGYYGSRIRDYMNIAPKCPVLLIFPKEEKSFNVKELIDFLGRRKIEIHRLTGEHGFSDPFSRNYCEQSSEEAERLVSNFLMKINCVLGHKSRETRKI